MLHPGRLVCKSEACDLHNITGWHASRGCPEVTVSRSTRSRHLLAYLPTQSAPVIQQQCDLLANSICAVHSSARHHGSNTLEHTIMSSSTKPLPMPSRASAASLMFLPARILPFLALALGLLRCSCLMAAGRVGLVRAACSAISSSVAPPITFFVLLRLGRLLLGICLLVSGCRLLQEMRKLVQQLLPYTHE